MPLSRAASNHFLHKKENQPETGIADLERKVRQLTPHAPDQFTPPDRGYSRVSQRRDRPDTNTNPGTKIRLSSATATLFMAMAIYTANSMKAHTWLVLYNKPTCVSSSACEFLIVWPYALELGED